MCWQPSHRLLYSGSVAGTVHAWDVEKREQRCCLEGHTDIVMQVLGVDYLDNIISASLDKTISIWDSYTEQQTATLRGHNKGVNNLSYNSTHRFLISTGFEPDIFVWSPFVSTLLYKLKGHRAVRIGWRRCMHTIAKPHQETVWFRVLTISALLRLLSFGRPSSVAARLKGLRS